MLEHDAASKYAKALFELGEKAGCLDLYSTQLASIIAVFNSHEQLRRFLFHPQVKAALKKDILAKIFGRENDHIILNFLMLLVDRRRISGINTIWDEFRRLVNAARNVEEAEVTTAVALGERAKIALQQKLTQVTGKEIILHTKIDVAIVGGVIVRMGDKLVDGSVARQLLDLRRTLTSAKLKS